MTIRTPVPPSNDEEDKEEEEEVIPAPKKRKAESPTAAPAKRATVRIPDSRPAEKSRISEIAAAKKGGATISLPKARSAHISRSFTFRQASCATVSKLCFLRMKLGVTKSSLKAPQSKRPAPRAKPSPAACPETPQASASAKSTSTAAPPKDKEVVQVESDVESYGGDVGGPGAGSEQGGADSGHARVEEITKKMAEALAHDAMDSPKGATPSAKVRAYSVKPYAELNKWEKWELTNDTIEQLMQDVWGKSDAEIENLDKFQYYMNQFILRQKTARKVCNFHYPLAPERQGGFSLKIRLGALRVAI